MIINIRDYRLIDAKEVSDLFYHSVHNISILDYSQEELDVWAPTPIDYEKWRIRFERTKPFIAEIGGTIVGFAELEDNGHIDCFYVHKDFQRSGVGKQLMEKIFDTAQKKGITKLFAESSISALLFFNSFGFVTVKSNIVERGMVALKNYIVEKQMV